MDILPTLVRADDFAQRMLGDDGIVCRVDADMSEEDLMTAEFIGIRTPEPKGADLRGLIDERIGSVSVRAVSGGLPNKKK